MRIIALWWERKAEVDYGHIDDHLQWVAHWCALFHRPANHWSSGEWSAISWSVHIEPLHLHGPRRCWLSWMSTWKYTGLIWTRNNGSWIHDIHCLYVTQLVQLGLVSTFEDIVQVGHVEHVKAVINGNVRFLPWFETARIGRYNKVLPMDTKVSVDKGTLVAMLTSRMSGSRTSGSHQRLSTARITDKNRMKMNKFSLHSL